MLCHHVQGGRALQRVIDVPPEDRQILGEPVPVLGEQVAFNAVHERVKPLGHGGLLVNRLAAHQALP